MRTLAHGLGIGDDTSKDGEENSCIPLSKSRTNAFYPGQAAVLRELHPEPWSTERLLRSITRVPVCQAE